MLEQMTLKDAAPHAPCPLLILHGDRDRVVPHTEADVLKAAAGTRAELHHHPKGNHACVTVLADWALPLATEWATAHTVRKAGN